MTRFQLPERVYDEPTLNKLCAEYQKLLGLEDWDVQVYLVEQEEIPSLDGQLTYGVEMKRAIIRIPDNNKWAGCKLMGSQDMQNTLIHELIHLHFCIFDTFLEKDSVHKQLFEIGINKMSKAFCSLIGEPIVDKTESDEVKRVDHPEFKNDGC